MNLIRKMEGFAQTVQIIHRYPYAQKYTFIDNARYVETLKKDVTAGNEIYCLELLFRAHIAAITTVLRNEKWIHGIDSALQESNFFAFSALLRGLVESAADSVSCLTYVPMTLAKNYRMLRAALRREVNHGIVCCEELEDILIHYSHARKQPKGAGIPQHYSAKTSQDYLRFLEGPPVGAVQNLYAELCEITHPTQRTVAIFITRDAADSEEYTLRNDLDSELVADLCARHDRAFSNVFEMSLNAALITLYVLNRFEDPRLFTRGIEDINLSKIDAFREVLETLGQA